MGHHLWSLQPLGKLHVTELRNFSEYFYGVTLNTRSGTLPWNETCAPQPQGELGIMGLPIAKGLAAKLLLHVDRDQRWCQIMKELVTKAGGLTGKWEGLSWRDRLTS